MMVPAQVQEQQQQGTAKATPPQPPQLQHAFDGPVVASMHSIFRSHEQGSAVAAFAPNGVAAPASSPFVVPPIEQRKPPPSSSSSSSSPLRFSPPAIQLASQPPQAHLLPLQPSSTTSTADAALAISLLTCREAMPHYFDFSDLKNPPRLLLLPHVVTTVSYVALTQAVRRKRASRKRPAVIPTRTLERIAACASKIAKRKGQLLNSKSQQPAGWLKQVAPRKIPLQRKLKKLPEVVRLKRVGVPVWPLEQDIPLCYDWGPNSSLKLNSPQSMLGTHAWNQILVLETAQALFQDNNNNSNNNSSSNIHDPARTIMSMDNVLKLVSTRVPQVTPVDFLVALRANLSHPRSSLPPPPPALIAMNQKTTVNHTAAVAAASPPNSGTENNHPASAATFAAPSPNGITTTATTVAAAEMDTTTSAENNNNNDDDDDVVAKSVADFVANTMTQLYHVLSTQEADRSYEAECHLLRADTIRERMAQFHETARELKARHVQLQLLHANNNNNNNVSMAVDENEEVSAPAAAHASTEHHPQPPRGNENHINRAEEMMDIDDYDNNGKKKASSPTMAIMKDDDEPCAAPLWMAKLGALLSSSTSAKRKSYQPEHDYLGFTAAS